MMSKKNFFIYIQYSEGGEHTHYYYYYQMIEIYTQIQIESILEM